MTSLSINFMELNFTRPSCTNEILNQPDFQIQIFLILSIMVQIVSIIAGSLGNFFVFYAVSQSTVLRQVANIPVVCLSVVDSVALLYMPLRVISTGVLLFYTPEQLKNPTSRLPTSVCETINFCDTYTSLAQMGILVMISFDRLKAVTHPLQKKDRMSSIRFNVIATLVVTTVLSAAQFALFRETPFLDTCLLNVNLKPTVRKMISMAFVCFAISLTILSVFIFYFLILRKLNRNVVTNTLGSKSNKVSPISTAAKAISDRIPDHLNKSIDSSNAATTASAATVAFIPALKQNEFVFKQNDSLPGNQVKRKIDHQPIHIIFELVSEDVKTQNSSSTEDDEFREKHNSVKNISHLIPPKMSTSVANEPPPMVQNSTLDFNPSIDIQQELKKPQEDQRKEKKENLDKDEQPEIEKEKYDSVLENNLQIPTMSNSQSQPRQIEVFRRNKKSEVLTIDNNNTAIVGAVCIFNKGNSVQSKRRLEGRTAKRASLSIIIFLVCFLPTLVIQIYITLVEIRHHSSDNKCQTTPQKVWTIFKVEIISYTVSGLRVAFNVCAYAFINRQYTTEFKKMCRHIKQRCCTKFSR